MSNTQHVQAGDNDGKSNRKRKPELDLDSAARAPKQAKGEGKKSKKPDCPGCKLKDDEVPDDGLHVDEFCSKCLDIWPCYFCNGCNLFCYRDLEDELDLCPSCIMKNGVRCGDCGQVFSCGPEDDPHVCPVDSDDEGDGPKCEVCHKRLDSGVCWWAHNRCTGTCGKPRPLCRCILMSPEEEKMIQEISVGADVENVSWSGVQRGPDWEILQQRINKVLKFVKAKAEAQCVLRAAPGRI